MSTADEIPAVAASAQTGASGSSFYAGMRVLPKAQREAMFAIYAFCRQVDDIADDLEGSVEDRRAGLSAWRTSLDSLYRNQPVGRAAFLAPHVRRFALDRADFLSVIDGMEMDVEQDIRAPNLQTLDLYCDRVASAVGRLSVRVFGMDARPGVELAHHLGRALQLTNILRDLDEDAEIGRLYLPLERLREAGIESEEPVSVVDDPRVDAVARAVAQTAHEHYAAVDRLLAAKPAGRLIAPRLMSAVYGRILNRMTAQGWAPPRRPVRIGKPELLWLVLRRGLMG